MKTKTKLRVKVLAVAATAFASLAPGSAALGESQAVSAAVVQGCDLSAESHSRELSSSELIARCHDSVLALATGPANRVSADGTLHVFGYHGLLFIDHLNVAQPNPDGSVPTTNAVVSGTNVVFKNVQAVAIDQSHSEIFVLDPSTKSVSVYSTSEDGNIYPRRKLISDGLEDGTSIAVDPVNGELVVLESAKNAIAVFGRMASVDGRKPINSSQQTRTINLSALLSSGTSFVDAAISPKHSELYLLDQGGGQIVAVSRAASRASAPQTFGKAGSLTKTQYVLYSTTDDTIRAMNSDGTGLLFPAGPLPSP